MTSIAALRATFEALLRALLSLLFIGFIERPTLCCTDAGGVADVPVDFYSVATGTLFFAALMAPVFLLTVSTLQRVVGDPATRAFIGGAAALTLLVAGWDLVQAEYWIDGERWTPLSYFTVAASGGAAGVIAHWGMRQGRLRDGDSGSSSQKP